MDVRSCSSTGGGAVQSNQRTVKFKVSSTYRSGKSLPVEAIVHVHLKVTDIHVHVPSHSMPFDQKWKHLVALPLADSKVPRSINILLGPDSFSRAVIQGLVLSPLGTSSKINTCFGWTLTSTVQNRCTPKD